MRIVARNQILIKFIIEFDVLFANRIKTFIQQYLIREEKRAPRQIKL